MSIVYFSILTGVVSVFVQFLVTRQFLDYLERDNKPKFDEVWSGSEPIWSYFYPFRIGLLYALPGTFEVWELSDDGLRSARRLRIISIFSALAFLGVAVALVIEFLL
jgi:hypothetical protein